MKKMTFLKMSIAISFLGLAGCSSFDKNLHASTAAASINAQTAQIVTRPTEYAYETVGEAIGHAYTKTMFGFHVDGDSVSTMSVAGMAGAGPLESLAAFRAVESLDGDAFFQIATEEERTGIWGFGTTKVKVTGKVLKIKDLGTMSAVRADDLEKVEAQKDESLFAELF